MDIKRITNKDGKLIHEYNVTIDDLEEVSKYFPDSTKGDIENTLTKFKCVLKEVNGEYTLYAVDKLWDGNTDSNEEIVDVPVTEVESPTKE